MNHVKNSVQMSKRTKFCLYYHEMQLTEIFAVRSENDMKYTG